MVAFPDTTLPLTLEAAFGVDLTSNPTVWQFTDLTDRLISSTVRINAGRGEGSAQSSPTTGTVGPVDNDDGQLTPLDPRSQWWPSVDLNLPIRVGVTRNENWDFETDVTGWTAVNSAVTRSTAQAHRGDGSLLLTPDGLGSLTAQANGEFIPVMPGTNWIISGWVYSPAGLGFAGIGYRLTDSSQVLVSSDVALGDEPAAGVWTYQSRLVTIPAGVAYLQAVVFVSGTPTVGDIMYADEVRVCTVRLAGYAASIDPTFVPLPDGTTHSTVQIGVAGSLHRVAAGRPPTQSAPRRYIPTTSPLAYWALDDGPKSSSGALTAGFGSTTRRVRGTVRWGSHQIAEHLETVVDLAGGEIQATSASSTTTAWVVDMILSRNVGTDAFAPYVFGTGGGDASDPRYDWDIVIDPDDELVTVEYREVAASTTVNTVDSESVPHLFDGLAHHLRFAVATNGTGADWAVYVDGTAVMSGTRASSTVQRYWAHTIGSSAAAVTGEVFAVAHIAAWNTADAPAVATAASAAAGWLYETAADRVDRIAGEVDTTVTIVGDVDESQPMGPEDPSATPLAELQSAEDVDRGFLHEALFGLRYVTGGARANPAASMTVDLSTYRRSGDTDQADVLRPTRNDQGTLNGIEVNRPGGARYTTTDEAHAARYLPYDSSASPNVPNDWYLPHQAGVRLREGTIVELRLPQMTLDLAANPGMIDDWLGVQLADRVTWTNPPDLYPPGDIDRVLTGYAEVLGPNLWMVQPVTAPLEPWIVAEYAADDADSGDDVDRYDTDGSELGVAADDNDTTLYVSTTQSDLWTQAADDLPMDLRVGGGEQVTVSAVAAGAADSFTRSVSNGWGTSTSGHVWTASGGAASDRSVSGTQGLITLASAPTTPRYMALAGVTSRAVQILVAATPAQTSTGGTLYALAVGLFSSSVTSNAALGVGFQTDGTLTAAAMLSGGLAFNTTATGYSYSPGTKVWMRYRLVPTSGTAWYASVRVWPDGTAEPTGVWLRQTTFSGFAARGIALAYVGGSGNNNASPQVAFDDLTLLNPQAMTVTRGVNDVQRAWAVGSTVELWRPSYYSL